MESGRSSPSKKGSADPLRDLLENLMQNPKPGLFSSSSTYNREQTNFLNPVDAKFMKVLHANKHKFVVLDDWWLVTSNVEGESKGLAVGGYIAKKERQLPFTSTPIVKRHDTYTLEVANGVTVKVEGMINRTNTLKNGFSHEMCERFAIGFPIFWKQYTLGDSPGSITSKEFEPAHEGSPSSSDNNTEAKKVVNLEEGDTTNLEKEDTTSNKGSDAPGRSGRTKVAVVNNEEEETTDVEKEDTKAHGATDYVPLSESNIRRSRSGRAIIPAVDKGSQTVVYDQNGNFAGIGSTSKPSRKKRRF